MHLLVADAGNTSITFGVFEAEKLLGSFFTGRRTAPGKDDLLASLKHWLASCGLARLESAEAIVGSVGPGTNELLGVLETLTGRPAQRATTTAPRLGMSIAYADPSSLGIDRLANALAAYDWLKSAAIVVDLGTATQFDCVSGDGRFVGGAICVGPQLSLDALSARSSRLPGLELSAPSTAMATDTKTALLSGAFYGQAALVDGMVKRLGEALGETCQVIATGGFAAVIGPECQLVNHIRPELTLHGLRIVWERTRTR